MAYFNHAFQKMFVGTGETLNPGQAESVTNPASSGGFITTTGVHSSEISKLGPGYFGMVDPKTWLTVADTFGGDGLSCCPLVLVSSSVLSSDKIGPQHGGYLETNKSKMINPKYVQRFYRVDPCVPKQAVIAIGNTPATTTTGIATVTLVPGAAVRTTYTANGVAAGTVTNVPILGGSGFGALASVTVAANVITAVTITNPGVGYLLADSGLTFDVTGDLAVAVAGNDDTVDVLTLTAAPTSGYQGGTGANDCCKEFVCGETYYLRIDVKGSPALRVLNHQAYYTVDAYTGCCSGAVPTAVDSTLVFISWAEKIVATPYLKDFVAPVVYDETGVAWYAPGTTVAPDGSGNAVLPAQWWDAYTSAGHTDGACAGMRLFGAFVDTRFQDCTFQVTDFFEKEPLRIYASLVDYTGDPCVFEGLCVYDECRGIQGMGFGETVVRDLIKSESYLQNFFHSDLRIREITQGNQMLDVITRTAFYTRYYLLHSVPRFNNPTGVFDNDRYLLEIVVEEADPENPVGNSVFEAFMENWLGDCPGCVELEVESCTPCEVITDPVEVLQIQ